MRQTSLKAWHEIQTVLGQRHEMVMEALRTIQPATAYEVARHLGFSDPNAVRPRINELYMKQLIKENGIRKCNITGKKAIEWVLT